MGILAGAAAGAAGTAALNAATYIDMAVRGRDTSETPQQTVEAIEDRLPVSVPGDDQQRSNRLAGLGSLSGIVTGVGIGAVMVGLAAMASTGISMTVLKVTDPRTWSAADWLSDAFPHLVYGAVTYATLDALDRRRA